MLTRRTRRSAPLLVAVLAGTAMLGACTYSAEPAPGQPTSPDGFTTGGFPPPGPPPQPGVITPAPQPQVAPSDAPRPERGAVPTQGPQTSLNPPRTTNAPQPAPGS